MEPTTASPDENDANITTITAQEKSHVVSASKADSTQNSMSDVIGEEKEPIAQLHAKTFLAVFAQTQDIELVFGGANTGIWLTTTITIMTTVLSPIVSQAADYWGRRWFLIGLTASGAIGSIIIARSTSTGMAIGGFFITGLSYGAQPLLHTVASEVLPRRFRPYAQAADNGSAALGGLVGLLVGGALTRHQNAEGFRNYWYIATGLYLVATVLTWNGDTCLV